MFVIKSNDSTTFSESLSSIPVPTVWPQPLHIKKDSPSWSLAIIQKYRIITCNQSISRRETFSEMREWIYWFGFLFIWNPICKDFTDRICQRRFLIVTTFPCRSISGLYNLLIHLKKKVSRSVLPFSALRNDILKKRPLTFHMSHLSGSLALAYTH